MAGANRGQATAASELHNQENMLSRLRGSAKPRAAPCENQENLPPKQATVGGRTVLGALQNNLRSKTQNQRGTKQVGSGRPELQGSCGCLLITVIKMEWHCCFLEATHLRYLASQNNSYLCRLAFKKKNVFEL